MNKRQKQVQQAFLIDEQETADRLRKVYANAEKSIDDKIQQLLARQDANSQTVIYQVQYQEALKKQVSGILDILQSEQFTTVSDYLERCYTNGYTGAMYDIAGQIGAPVVMAVDPEQVVRAVQTDSKISEGLYKHLEGGVKSMKRKISATISRGISTGMSYGQMAMLLNKHSSAGMKNTMRICRTEGHRIQVQSSMDACKAAKDNGCDVVKQWDATLDKRTRKSHQRVDGEIREMDEPFSNGLMFPGDPAGGASEVINCRCALLQRAKWALDEDELETLKERAEYYGLTAEKNSTFEDFKAKYLVAAQATNSGYAGKGVDNSPDVSYIDGEYGSTHAKAVKDRLEKADQDVQDVWNKYQGKFKTDDPNYSGGQAFYSPSSDSVRLNIKYAESGSSYQTPYQVLYHEYGHMTDYLSAREFGYNGYTAFTEVFDGVDASGNPIFTQKGMGGLLGRTAKDELNTALKAIKKANGVTRKTQAAQILIDEIKANYSLIARSDVSDMLEGAGIGVSYPLGVGHGKGYWKGRDNGKEIFAEMLSADTASPESVACIKKYFPETYKVYKTILGVIK